MSSPKKTKLKQLISITLLASLVVLIIFWHDARISRLQPFYDAAEAATIEIDKESGSLGDPATKFLVCPAQQKEILDMLLSSLDEMDVSSKDLLADKQRLQSAIGVVENYEQNGPKAGTGKAPAEHELSQIKGFIGDIARNRENSVLSRLKHKPWVFFNLQQTESMPYLVAAKANTSTDVKKFRDMTKQSSDLFDFVDGKAMGVKMNADLDALAFQMEKLCGQSRFTFISTVMAMRHPESTGLVADFIKIQTDAHQLMKLAAEHLKDMSHKDADQIADYEASMNRRLIEFPQT